MKTWRGYDYVLNKGVEHTRKEWLDMIEALKARGGRTVRHPVNNERRFLGDNDLLLMEGGQIIAEVYDKD